MKYQVILFALLFSIISFQCNNGEEALAPAPVLPFPSPQHIAWQELEFYAFVHFNMNTFTNQEWGFGDEDPKLFNPTELDCKQWAKVAKESGMKGIIITAKHHDGFCLWPSKYTEHSVKSASWKNGQGDVVRELADACKEFGLKLGIYYSPWDRNHADYGKPEYLTYMRNQLHELLTDYGEVFEVWFDGANGGTGYYGGANEERRVDKKTYYDMQNTYPIIRELQPNALIFSDAGPDVRWVGNEDGYAFETMWSNLLRDSVYAGMPEYSKLYASGQELGTHWVPGETNVSIRPGWYYHEYEDHKVRSIPALVDMYYNSIGRNTTFLLNFPVDKRGLIHENDVKQLQAFTDIIKKDFTTNLAAGSKIVASDSRGKPFTANKIVDGDKATYWAASDGNTQANFTLTLPSSTIINRLLIQEHIALGQRVKAFKVEAKTPEGWEEIVNETTIGYKRILRFPEIETSSIKVSITDAKAAPTIANIELYHAPKLVLPPTITRNQAGIVTLAVPDESVAIYYTTNGDLPTVNSPKYSEPFLLKEPVTVKAIARSSDTESGISQTDFDIATTNWNIDSDDVNATRLIDGNLSTWWENKDNKSLIIDLGKEYTISGFNYLPMQGRWITGFISEYEFYTSLDGKNWQLASKGEFGNILNSPINQRITCSPHQGQFVKFKAIKTIEDTSPAYAEFSVLTE